MELQHHKMDWSQPAPPCTWDYLPPRPESVVTAHDFAVVTCSHGHTMRLVTTTHRVLRDGWLMPSLVCPYSCSFHEFVRLVGWKAP